MADALEAVRSALADRYVIQRELGRGGMATVYLAEDPKHHRLVAIKVLKPELATALGPERFLREIEFTGQLRHPNILPLYDSGQVDTDLLYYVMPYVEGESLRARLAREKQLPLADALQITRDVAEALGHAHSWGVIHRDIKPENILLESGRAVVADFGIAKAVTAAGGEKLTETGLAIGTPAYMSPEQAAGTADLDPRSDLYSLGTVLYEMLAGDPPFTGATPQAILARKSVDAIPSLRTVRESVSPAIEQAVFTALARVPADRFRTAGEFAEALIERDAPPVTPGEVQHGRPRRGVMVAGAGLVVAVAGWLLATWGDGGAVAVDTNVVAVWPFEIVAPDTSLEYLREGAVHYVHGILTGDGLPQGVDPRTALNAWGQAGLDRRVPAPADLAALARRLGAGQMLLGSVISDPRQLTIRASLQRAADGKIVAEYSVVGARDSVFVLLERATLGLLGVAVGEGAGRADRLAEHPPAAVMAYLAGKRLLRQGDIENAARRLEEALAIDSTFALAALAHLGTGDVGGGFNEASRQRVWALRDRLPNRDRALLVAVEDIGPRFPAIPTRRELLDAARAAVATNPVSVEAWRLLATRLANDGALLGIVDWPEQAWRAFERVMELDSTDALAASHLLELALAAGEPDVIERFGALFQRIAPRHPYADAYRWWVATELGDSGRVAEERSRFAHFSDISVNSMDRISILRGYPLTDAVRAFEARTSNRAIDESMRWIYAWGYVEIAFAQGRVADGLAHLDSVVVAAATNPDAVFSPLAVTTASYLVAQSLVEPGFDDAAAQAAARLSALADTSGDADATCYAEMWRLSRGDTSRVRGTLEQLREHSSALGQRINYPFFGVGTGRTCVAFLQAQLAELGSWTADDGALDRLEAHVLEGSYELPGNIANLMLARWHASRGALPEALAALERRPSVGTPPMTFIVPAWMRDEGRLAAATGDRARAVRAYRHYLTLRSDPDPGPLMDEVERVRVELEALQ